jgi:hypothetical protein
MVLTTSVPKTTTPRSLSGRFAPMQARFLQVGTPLAVFGWPNGRRLRRRRCGAETPHHTTPYNIHPSIHTETVSHPYHTPVRHPANHVTPFCCGAPSAWPRRTGKLSLPAWGGEKGKPKGSPPTISLGCRCRPGRSRRLPAAAAAGIAAASTQSFDFASRAFQAGSFCLRTMLTHLAYAKSVS